MAFDTVALTANVVIMKTKLASHLNEEAYLHTSKFPTVISSHSLLYGRLIVREW